MAQNDGWDVVSTAPMPKESAGDGWEVVSKSAVPTPAVDMSKVAGAQGPLPTPSAHPAVDMKPSIFGRDGSPGTVGQKLFGDKPLTNSITVPLQHAKQLITAPYDAFSDAPESVPEQAVNDTQGRAGLGLYRMLAKPTVEGKGMDRIPIVGPMARGVENDAKTYGAIPALLGLGTDMLAPKAAEGLYGGAAKLAGKGMQAAAATPESLKVAATRGLVTGSPGELLNRSLKPPVTKPDFEQSVEASLPRIAAQNPKGVSGFANAANNARGEAAKWYSDLKNPYLDDPIDTTGAVRNQVGRIPATNMFENPGIIDSTIAKAKSYDMTPQTSTVTSPILDEFGKPIQRTQTYTPPSPPLGLVDDIRMDTNAKLNDFYNKSGGDRNAALSHPETARIKAVNDSTRDLVYNHLSDRSGVPRGDIDASQNLYGHLTDVADVAGRRATVAGRANPLSLQESLQLHGNPITQAYNFGTSRLFKGLTDSDAVTNAAIDRFNSPNAINFPPRDNPFLRNLSTAGKGTVEAGKLKPFLTPSIVTAQGGRKRDLFER